MGDLSQFKSNRFWIGLLLAALFAEIRWWQIALVLLVIGAFILGRLTA